jgi:hypothetical protein
MHRTLHVAAGKRGKQSLVAANNCSNSANRLYVTDRLTKTSFLVDTGADLCVYPRYRLGERRTHSTYELFAAKGTAVRTYGCTTLHLDFGLRREFSWRFVVADVTGPIIGSDFLSFYDLLVEVRHQRLIDNITKLTVNGAPVGTYGDHIKVLAGSSRYHTTLLDFPEIISPAGVPREPRHATVHHIRTTPGPPVASRPRRLAPDRLRISKYDFEEMIRNGIARCSDSTWASPLHLVPKKEDGWRPCGDCRALNARSVPDQYTVRYIADFAHQPAGRKDFCTIDLVKAYHQIPVHPDDVAKTAIITPFGLFEFPCMSFGLRNATQTVQLFIDEVLTDLDFCYTYIDAVLFASTSEDEYEQHTRTFFQRFSEYGVLLNPAKFVFGATKLTFLGYTSSAEGTRPLEEKFAAINRFQRPALAKDLRFLSHAEFLPAVNTTSRQHTSATSRCIGWSQEK